MTAEIPDDVFDTGVENLNSSAMNDVGILAQKALDLKAQIEANQDLVKSMSNELRQLEERELVDAMDAANCAEFKCSDGSVIKIKDIVSASVPKAKVPTALEALRELFRAKALEKNPSLDEEAQELAASEADALVKHNLLIPLGRGKDNLVTELFDMLTRDYGLAPEDDQSIHGQTLGAFCRKHIASGGTFTDEQGAALGLYTARKAEIK